MRGDRDMSYFACHVEKFKSNDVRGLQIHNQRESSNSKNNDIDPYRTILNYDLHNKDKINYNQRVKEIIAEGYKGAKAIRKDATVMTSTIVTSDKGFFDKLSLKEQRLFFEESYKFLKECYGEKNIVSAVVHMDETTPHMHLHFVPVNQENGKLQARALMTPARINKIHTEAPKYLQQKGFDVERGKGKTEKNLDIHRFKAEKLREDINILEDRLNALEGDLGVIQGARVQIECLDSIEIKKSHLGTKISLKECCWLKFNF